MSSDFLLEIGKPTYLATSLTFSNDTFLNLDGGVSGVEVLEIELTLSEDSEGQILH